MIRAVVVCPPAPFLIAGLAPNLLRQTADLAAACHRAVSGLAGLDRIVVLAPAADWRVLAPGTRLHGAMFARSDVPIVAPVLLPGGTPIEITTGASTQLPPAAAAVVAGYLLAEAGIRVPTEVVELPAGRSADAEALLAQAHGDIGVLAMADGAAAHGPHAPMAEDDRAELVDQLVTGALQAGDPAALATATRDDPLMATLGVAGVEVLRTLARLPAPESAALTAYAAPFGVGYLVATWCYGPDRR